MEPARPTAEPTVAPSSNKPVETEPATEEHEQAQEVEVPEVRSTVPQAVGGGFPEPPGKDPGDISQDSEPHHALNTPVGDPDRTEWPDPYDRREDPRDPPERDRVDD